MRRFRVAIQIAPVVALVCASCAMLVGLEDKQPLVDGPDGTDGTDGPPTVDAPGDNDVDTGVDGGPATEIVAADQNAPFGIAVDETYVYWTNSQSGTVWRRVKTLASGAELVAQNQLGPKHMLTDESFIYWFNDNNPAAKDIDGATLVEPLVMRIPRAVPSPVPEAVFATNGSGSFVRASLRLQGAADAYLFGVTTGTVRRYTRIPTQIQTVHTTGTINLCDGVATDDLYVYWHNKTGSQTWRRAKGFTGTNAAPYPEKVGLPLDALEIVRDMAADDQSIFFASASGNVLRMDKICTGGAPYTDGGAGIYPADAGDAGPATRVADSGADLRRLVIKDDRIYLARWTSGADGEILALSKTTGAITAVARGQNDPVDLAVDTNGADTFVYWTSSGDGTIRRAPVPK